MNVSVAGMVQMIIVYFGEEQAGSSDDRDRVRRYIAGGNANRTAVFSPGKIETQLSSGAIDIIASVDPNNKHSESRKFRKMLEIFMVASKEQAGQPPG
jgi:hypothetical protein